MNSNYALKILRILSDGKKHTLDSLSILLKLNQDEVIQVINITLLNYKINLTNNICHLLEPIVWINKEALFSQIKLAQNKFEIIILDEIDSTNNYLKTLLKKK